jgi:hypothetical protein
MQRNMCRGTLGGGGREIESGVSKAVRATASGVITAIHAGQQILAVFPKTRGHRPDRSFIVTEHKDGSETLALEGSTAPDRELGDLAALQT